MCFRILKIALSVLLISGCGLKVGEKPAKDEQLAYSGKGFSCIGEIPAQIQSYVADEMSVEGINQFMTCLQRSFTSFAKLTRGGDGSTYSPERLRAFFEGTFLKDRKISDSLLYEFMVIKQFLVGGSVKTLTRAELYGAVAFLEDIRVEAIRIKPHLKMLNPQLAVKQELSGFGPRLNEANEALRMTAQVFAKRLERSGNPYEISHFEAFIGEFRKFLDWEKHFQESHSPKRWADFLRAYKQMVTPGANANVIQPTEFLPLLQSLSSWYLTYLQYQIGVKGQSVQKGVGLQNLMYLGDQILDLVSNAINRRPSKTIPFSAINQLIDATTQMGWLPPPFRAESVQQAVKSLIVRVFGDSGIAPSDRTAQGLTLQTVANMKAEFYRWTYVQMNLDDQFASGAAAGDPIPDLQSVATGPIGVKVLPSELRGSGWDDFIKVREYVRPLYSSRGGDRIWVTSVADLGKYQLVNGFNSLSHMNLLRSLVGLVFRGYAEQSSARNLWKSGLSETELKKFFEDFREFGIDVGLVDQRVHNTGSRTFVEGNLFTFDGDGLNTAASGIKTEISFIETIELFAFLYSGGTMSQSIQKNIEQYCPRLGSEDVTGKKRFARDCVRTQLGHVIVDETFNLPNLQQFLQSKTEDERKEYAAVLVDTAYSPKNSDPNWVENSEIATLSVITQYSEAVMTRFDSNGDGILVTSEFEAAIPHFIGYIQRMADEKLGIKGMSDSRARAVLVFILANKYIPDASSWGDASTVWQYENWSEPSLSLNRFDMARVFKAIGQKLVTAGVNSSSPEAAK